MTGLCASCGKDHELIARRLCIHCYHAHKRAGTLDRFPLLASKGSGIPALGISYRQLDFWVRQGYLKPTHGGGSGVPREWPEEEVRVAEAMARLVAAGFRPAVAAKVARGEVELDVKALVSA